MAAFARFTGKEVCQAFGFGLGAFNDFAHDTSCSCVVIAS
jgi:hypothetical protein